MDITWCIRLEESGTPDYVYRAEHRLVDTDNLIDCLIMDGHITIPGTYIACGAEIIGGAIYMSRLQTYRVYRTNTIYASSASGPGLHGSGLNARKWMDDTPDHVEPPMRFVHIWPPKQ